MSSVSDLFVKSKPVILISKKDIYDSIPDLNVKNKDENKRNTMTEMRWKIFNIPVDNSHIEKKEVIEISIKYPNKPRLYINNKGEWVEKNYTECYDSFLTEQYYHYSDDT